jgi:hypothetical protein
LLVAGGGGRVIAGQLLHRAQLVKGAGLAGQVADLAVQRRRPGQAGCTGRVVPGVTLHGAQLAERVGFAEPVSGLARCCEGRPVEGSGLIPVTALEEEAGYRAGDLDRVQMPSVDGGVVCGGVQVGTLCFQPGDGLPGCGQVRALGRPDAGRLAAVSDVPGGKVPAGG